MSKIKICGLSRAVDIDMVNIFLPDYVGFVFAESRRKVTDSVAYELRQKLNPAILPVGVFVNEEMDRIVRLCKEKTIELIQLHGEEDEAYIKELKERVTNPIIKAVRVKNVEDIHKAAQLPTDFLLLDTYVEGQQGGSGKTFEWSLIKGLDCPYFLAGGLHPKNVLAAIAEGKPYAVDVSSGVETDGFKDKDKIIEFISKVRSVGECQKEDLESMEGNIYLKR